jgi:hypothetical protein
MGLVQALDAVVAALRSTGMQATTDPRDLSIPGAWVTVHDVTETTLCGSLVIRADVHLIAGDMGSPQYLRDLDTLLDQAMGVLTLEEPARPAVSTPSGVGPLPSLIVTTSTDTF